MTSPNTDTMVQEPVSGTGSESGREALIEALARWYFNDSLESMMAALPWEKASDYTKTPFLAEARGFMPVIVDFVAAWLLDCGTAEDKQLVARWYEDMETPAERYARLNIKLADGRRLLGPLDPPVVTDRPREAGGRGE